MTKQQAGAIGGRATVARHGREHMQQIGRKGATVTWTRYKMVPIGMTDRTTGKILRIIGR